MSKSCTDCFWCKINRSRGYIRCIVDKDDETLSDDKTFSHWMKVNETEKIIKLNNSEIKGVFIQWRDIFASAQRCPSMKSMV